MSQVSKSIADSATGRILAQGSLSGVTHWLTATNLNHTSLIKRSAWSILYLNQIQNSKWTEDSSPAKFLSSDQNAKWQGVFCFASKTSNNCFSCISASIISFSRNSCERRGSGGVHLRDILIPCTENKRWVSPLYESQFRTAISSSALYRNRRARC